MESDKEESTTKWLVLNGAAEEINKDIIEENIPQLNKNLQMQTKVLMRSLTPLHRQMQIVSCNYVWSEIVLCVNLQHSSLFMIRATLSLTMNRWSLFFINISGILSKGKAINLKFEQL